MTMHLRFGPRPTMWTPEKVAELITLRQSGVTNCEIGRKFRCAEVTVTKKVRELQAMGIDIARRPPGPAAGTIYTKRQQLEPIDEANPSRKRREAEGRAKVEGRAQLLMKFWHAKGYPQVLAWVVQEGVDRNYMPIFGLRSNLVNGLPPKQHPAIRQAAE